VPRLVAAAISAALAMATFESRKLSDLGLHWNAAAGHNLLAGIAAGVAGASLLILPPVAIGLAHFERAHDGSVTLPGALLIVALLFCGAAGEEIAFRGFPLQVLMRGYGSWASILGMGAVFGVMHRFNPGATTLSTVNTAGFGILFGVTLLRSHDLWLPLGIHFGWNATLPFLGVSLSGFTIRVTEYQLVWKAGDLWSGGAYGPEASLLASFVLLVLFVAVWKMPVRKGTASLLDSDVPDASEA
jgi:membrane protease YdiL (CAAX protease family)